MNVIQKGIKQNKKYNQAQSYAKKIQGISRTTNWFQTKTKYDGARRLQQQSKKTNKQLELGRAQLLIRRTTRLEQLYAKQIECWQAELRQKGISIFKNKV